MRTREELEAEIQNELSSYRQHRDRLRQLKKELAERFPKSEREYAARPKALCRMVIEGGLTLDEIVRLEKGSRNYLADQITFGACVLRDESDDARRLWDLFCTPGIGAIGSIKRFLESKRC